MTAPKDDWNFLRSRKLELENDLAILRQSLKQAANNSAALDIYRMIFKLKAELNKVNANNDKISARIEADYRKCNARIDRKLCGNE